MATATPRRWLITGAASGIGRALAAAALRAGDRVAVTARDPRRLVVLGGGDRIVPIALELTDRQSVARAAERVAQIFDGLDVLVNNAGYGLVGAVEHTGEEAALDQMAANFLGPAALTARLIPHLRAARGHIVNISSISGVIGAPGSAYYAASKHALEGWSTALRAEVEPFGVRVTVVEPGGFRTDFFGRSRRFIGLGDDRYPIVERRVKGPSERPGAQPGDPELAAQAIMTVVAHERPPRRLVLGAAAVDAIRRNLEARLAELAEWESLSRSTDRPSSGPHPRPA